MPMCQSPKIADVFLRGGECLQTTIGRRQRRHESFERDNAFKAAWQTLQIFSASSFPLFEPVGPLQGGQKLDLSRRDHAYRRQDSAALVIALHR
jgi:hypothetical protein